MPSGGQMAKTLPRDTGEDSEILLGLLNSVEENGARSQRHLAAELGIALGLVNAYLKRCVKKGLLKVGDAPARRYAYYLTPQGFAEKSRLTVEYLSASFSFFRRAKDDCARTFADARAHGWTRIVLVGKSDLAEIAILCAAEGQIEIVALVDEAPVSSHFAGIRVVRSLDDVASGFDAILITHLTQAQAALEQAIAQAGEDRVFAPALLGLRIAHISEAAQ